MAVPRARHAGPQKPVPPRKRPPYRHGRLRAAHGILPAVRADWLVPSLPWQAAVPRAAAPVALARPRRERAHESPGHVPDASRRTRSIAAVRPGGSAAGTPPPAARSYLARTVQPLLESSTAVAVEQPTNKGVGSLFSCRDSVQLQRPIDCIAA